MDKKLKAKWLRALRSGKIKQGRGALIDGKGRMCCIGVLGRVVGIDDETLLERSAYLRGTGLEKIDACNIDRFLDPLAVLNDGNKEKRPQSFKQIAKYIEKEIQCS